jgi:hypothetical protein
LSRVGKVLDSITPELGKWIAAQKMFFVATAPLSAEGHINCSPKGGDTFRVISANEVGYLDYVGSGAETAAHLRENGRMVLMFCAFQGSPKIVRLHGSGKVVAQSDSRFSELIKQFSPHVSTRSIILMKVNRVSSSCGFGVPLMTFQAERDEGEDWAEKKGPDGLRQYIHEKNRTSIDGLPAFQNGD